MENWKVCYQVECPGEIVCPICGAELSTRNGRLRECSCIRRRIARAYGMGIERGRAEGRQVAAAQHRRILGLVEKEIPVLAGTRRSA